MGTEEKRRQAPDGFGSVDDLFDAGHSQGDVHGGHACKVERLQGHLGARLADALGTECAYRRTGLHLCPRRKMWMESPVKLPGRSFCLLLFSRKNAFRVRKELATSLAVLVAEEEPGIDQ